MSDTKQAFWKISASAVSPSGDNSLVYIVCCARDNLNKTLEKAKLNVKIDQDDLIRGSFTIYGEVKLLYFDPEGEKNPYKIGSKLAQKLQKIKQTELYCVFDQEDHNALKIVEAILLRYPKFVLYKTKGTIPELKNLRIITENPESFRNKIEYINTLAENSTYMRELVNKPANHMRPSAFAAEARKLEQIGVKVKVLQGDEIKKMECLVAVGQGSSDKSKLIVLERIKDASKPVLGLVGKAVTFDTGGYSLKPAKSMETMHTDMTGGSLVLTIMRTVATLNLDTNIVVAIPCAENMVANDAYRPTDVYTSYSGQTVRIMNTDAEGRLILCDALSYIQEQYNPKILLDFATLTGAIVVALGETMAGVYSTDKALFKTVHKHGNEVWERVWRMPLDPEYNSLIDSPIADMDNISTKSVAGSITAAEFLHRFIDTSKTKWMHFDIAGTSFIEGSSLFADYGATGYGLRLIMSSLDDLVKSMIVE